MRQQSLQFRLPMLLLLVPHVSAVSTGSASLSSLLDLSSQSKETMSRDGGVPPPSLLPLISRFQHALGPAENHPQRYQTSRSRRRMEELDLSNTQRIRIIPDFSSLYEDTAPVYTACFRSGDWFRNGLPDGSGPPSNGVETCTRDSDSWRSSAEGCWGICQDRDVITAEKRTMVQRVVTEVVGEITELISVKRVETALTFTKSKGRYEQALLENGITPEEACASDCSVLSGVAVDPTYCTDGVNADAVLSVTKPPVVPGVRGSGSHCVADQQGRPLWLVFSWIESLDELSDDYEENLVNTRGLIIHEIIHALGFSNSMFNGARDSTGARKGLLALKQVTDVDGTTDQVWHFVRGRAYALAQQYFDCTDESKWLGLPLMGVPELGRGSHWETRIMRDDVMSYGFRSAVSPITLGALEDLGFYVGNYSAADCIRWGRGQGCDFVTSRCGIVTHDRSVNVTSSDECGGDPVWGVQTLSLLSQKCELGADPCSNVADAGFMVLDNGERVCDAQCYTGPIEGSCSEGLDSSVEDAGAVVTGSDSKRWVFWLWLGVWALGLLLFVSCVRLFLCPPDGSKAITATFSVVIGLCGVLFIGFSIYALWFEYDLFEAYVGKTTLYATFGVGIALAVYMGGSILGLKIESRILMLVLIVVGVILLLLEAAMAIVILYWVYSVDDVNSESIVVDGSSGGRWDGRFGGEFLAEVEGVACRTYQLCCRDPNLDGMAEIASGDASGSQGTCYTKPTDAQAEVVWASEDPSSDKFCRYVSGAKSSFEPAAGVCNALDRWVGDFSQQQCQEDFCSLGVDGYVVFLDDMVGFVQANAIAIGAVCSVLVMVQLILIVNMWNLRRTFRSNRIQAHDMDKAGRGRRVQPTKASEQRRTTPKERRTTSKDRQQQGGSHQNLNQCISGTC